MSRIGVHIRCFLATCLHDIPTIFVVQSDQTLSSIIGGFATYLVAMTSELAKSLSDNPDKNDIVDDIPMGRYGLFICFTSLVGIMSMLPLVKVICPPLSQSSAIFI